MECFMIIANPGINANTEINISWHTHLEYTNSKLIYTTTDDLDFKNAITIKGEYVYNDIFDNIYSITKDRVDYYEEVKILHYHVCLTNLSPNTNYMYKVGEKEYSDIHYFKTGNNNFSFVWVSDFHAYTPLPNRLLSAFSTTEKVINKVGKPDFILCGGDAIAWGGSYSFWKDMYEKDLVKKYLWVNILGNHDFMSRKHLYDTSAYFLSTNYFPRNGYPGEEGVAYHFTYGDTLFIIINSEAMGFVLESPEVDACRKWLCETLEETKCKYKIVCQHYDWFQGVNGKSRNFGYLRYKDIFDKYHVFLALANNNHIYLRTFPLYDDTISLNGTVYIQSPSSDNERGQEIIPYEFNENIFAHRFSEGGKTIGIIYVQSNIYEIKLTLYDRFLNIVDECIIKKNEFKDI